ncbi:MAG: hypothetical protein M1822_000036 [Bathelium mastoideum]|nr:MAG: hypothetical protein M1822_000036 [Bathelium mastoideum]
MSDNEELAHNGLEEGSLDDEDQLHHEEVLNNEEPEHDGAEEGLPDDRDPFYGEEAKCSEEPECSEESGYSEELGYSENPGSSADLACIEEPTGYVGGPGYGEETTGYSEESGYCEDPGSDEDLGYGEEPTGCGEELGYSEDPESSGESGHDEAHGPCEEPEFSETRENDEEPRYSEDSGFNGEARHIEEFAHDGESGCDEEFEYGEEFGRSGPECNEEFVHSEDTEDFVESNDAESLQSDNVADNIDECQDDYETVSDNRDYNDPDLEEGGPGCDYNDSSACGDHSLADLGSYHDNHNADLSESGNLNKGGFNRDDLDDQEQSYGHLNFQGNAYGGAASQDFGHESSGLEDDSYIGHNNGFRTDTGFGGCAGAGDGFALRNQVEWEGDHEIPCASAANFDDGVGYESRCEDRSRHEGGFDYRNELEPDYMIEHGYSPEPTDSPRSDDPPHSGYSPEVGYSMEPDWTSGPGDDAELEYPSCLGHSSDAEDGASSGFFLPSPYAFDPNQSRFSCYPGSSTGADGFLDSREISSSKLGSEPLTSNPFDDIQRDDPFTSKQSRIQDWDQTSSMDRSRQDYSGSDALGAYEAYFDPASPKQVFDGSSGKSRSQSFCQDEPSIGLCTRHPCSVSFDSVSCPCSKDEFDVDSKTYESRSRTSSLLYAEDALGSPSDADGLYLHKFCPYFRDGVDADSEPMSYRETPIFNGSSHYDSGERSDGMASDIDRPLQNNDDLVSDFINGTFNNSFIYNGVHRCSEADFELGDESYGENEEDIHRSNDRSSLPYAGTSPTDDIPNHHDTACSPSPVRGHQAIWSTYQPNTQAYTLEEDSKPLPQTPGSDELRSLHSRHARSIHSQVSDHVEEEIKSPRSHEAENTPVVETASLGTYFPSHELRLQRSEIDIPSSSSRALSEDEVADEERRDSVLDGIGHRVSRSPSPSGDGRKDVAYFENYGRRDLPLEQQAWRDSMQEKLLDRRTDHKNGTGKVSQCFRRRQTVSPRPLWTRIWPDIVLGLGCLLVLAVIVVLVMMIHLRHDDIPVQGQFLNLTGFPPIPTGISTIAQPSAVLQDSSCVKPTTVWDCDVPQEDRSAAYRSSQPEFRFEIRFKNSSAVESSSAQPTNGSSATPSRRAMNPVSAGAFIRRFTLATRDAFDDIAFTPMPPSPPDQEQRFLGHTTDNNTAPFDGEETPFYISFLNATALVGSTTLDSRSVRQQISSTKSSQNQQNGMIPEASVSDATVKTQSATPSSPFPNDASNVPAPNILANGYPAPANLLTFPQAQQLRLYNRGSQSEYYGFYTYFDRSVFLSTIGGPDAATSASSAPQDANGGAAASNATFRCTWSQTRFKVQIWTKKGNPLLGSSSSSNALLSTSNTTIAAGNSSANDWLAPGSFPYPTTITLDRHGGDASRKSVYCYALDVSGKIMRDEATWQWEDRGAGGTLVNPAVVPGNGTSNVVQKRSADGGQYGGVDGGSGGCGCAWQNFRGS